MEPYSYPQSLTEAIHRKNARAIDAFIRQGAHEVNKPSRRYSNDNEPDPILPLVEAVRQGDAGLVKRLIEAGAKVDGVPQLEPPISAAIKAGNLEVLDILHGAGASLEDPNKDDPLWKGLNYMREACCAPNSAALGWMIEHGGDATQAWQGVSSLANVSLVGAVLDKYDPEHGKEKLRLLRDNGADLNHGVWIKGTGSSSGYRLDPFSYAVASADGEVVRWFLEDGADPDRVCGHTMHVGGTRLGDGLPVLACAILSPGPDRRGVVNALVEYGADIERLMDFNANTIGPVCTPANSGQFRDNEPRIRNATYLMLAAAWSNAECVKAIIDNGGHVNATGTNKETALSVFFLKSFGSTHDRSLDVLMALLGAGADPNMANKDGNTPMHLLGGMCNHWVGWPPRDDVDQWSRDAAMALMGHGYDLEMRNIEGLTALGMIEEVHNAIAGVLRAQMERKAMQAGTLHAAGERKAGPRL